MGDRPVQESEYGSRIDPLALAGGIVGVIVLLGLTIAIPTIAAAGAALAEDKASAEPFEYIEARLLKFGEIKDKEKLPDRIVPALATAPEDIIPLDRNAFKEPPKETAPKQKRQTGAVVDDQLRQVFDKARAFAEVQDDYIPEGHPDGVPDGDVTDPALASIGATYGHRIRKVITERWVVPTLLTEAQLKGLKAKVLLKFDVDMSIVAMTFLQKSGNRLFDDSIQNAIDRVRAEVKNLPSPPEAIAPKVFGAGIALNMSGAEAHYE